MEGHEKSISHVVAKEAANKKATNQKGPNHTKDKCQGAGNRQLKRLPQTEMITFDVLRFYASG